MVHKTIKIGMGSGVIRFPASLFPTEGFCGVHDAPKIRIMLLRDGIFFAIVSCEMVMLPDVLIKQMQKSVEEMAGVPAENVWIHMTHAISTPHLPGEVPFPPSNDSPQTVEGKQKAYCVAVEKALKEAVKEAVFSMQEAILSVGRGICDINCNRDEKTPFGWWVGPGSDGKSNKIMTVLRAENIDGKLLGLLISYGLKPCVLDNSGMMDGTRQVSSDVTGYACAKLEQHLGVPVMFCMAAAGDQIPRDMALYEKVNTEGYPEYVDLGVEYGFEKVKELGNKMALDALRIAEEIQDIQENTLITKVETQFTWPSKSRSQMCPTKELAYRADGKQCVEVSALQIGDIALVAVKPEVNAITEEELWAVSPFDTTLLLSLVNGGMKYMPDRASYDKFTWESQSAILMPGAAEQFVCTAAELLNHLKEGS